MTGHQTLQIEIITHYTRDDTANINNQYQAIRNRPRVGAWILWRERSPGERPSLQGHRGWGFRTTPLSQPGQEYHSIFITSKAGLANTSRVPPRTVHLHLALDRGLLGMELGFRRGL